MWCLAGVLSGCVVPDRAGGHAVPQQVRTLTFADTNIGGTPPAPLVAWADDVERSSNGSLRIAFQHEWRAGQPLFERGTVGDVRAGTVDLGGVGARVLDRLGDDDFQAMLAPLLIDNLALESKVFEEGIPDQMLTGVQRLGVVGVGVIPGPLRRVLGRDTAFTTAAAFRGKTIAMQDSALTAETLKALGATPVPVPSSAHINRYDGYEQQVGSVYANGYWDRFQHLTSNVNLWPKPYVIVMGRDAYDSLTPDQRDALTAAQEPAVSDALDTVNTEDDAAVKGLCQTGLLSFATASQQNLSGLRRAVQPIYARLHQDPRTAAWLDQITRLKTELAAPPDKLSCPTGGTNPAPAENPGIPTGTYTRTITPADFRAVGMNPEREPGAIGEWTLVVDPSGFLKVRDPVDRDFEYWSYDRFHGNLRLSDSSINITMVAQVRYHDGELTFDVLRFTECGAVAGNGDCMMDPNRSDVPGGYELPLGGIPKPWVLRR